MIKTTDRNRSILAVLLASVLIDFVGVGIVLPLLPFYARIFGASPSEIGILLGLFPLASIFAPPLWGSLSDRIGRRPALLLNICGTALAYLWYALAQSLWALFAARILAGTFSASIVIAQSYVSDLTAPENRTKMLGFLEATVGIGFIIGPALGSLLMGGDPDNPNFRLPNFVAAAVSGLTFCLAFFALPRSRDRTPTSASEVHFSPQQFLAGVQETFQRPLVGKMMVWIFVIIFASTSTQVILPLWCERRFDWGPQQFGYFIILFSLATAFAQIVLTGRIVRWLGEVKSILWGAGAATLSLLLLPLSTTVFQFAGAMPFFVFAQAIGLPSLTSLLSQLSGAKQQGKTLGLMRSVGGLASFLGAMWAGFVFEALGEDWPHWTGGILMAIALAWGWQQITHSQVLGLKRHRLQQKFMHLFDFLDLDNSDTLELADFRQAGRNLAELRGCQSGTPEYEVLQATFVGFGEMLQRLADRNGDRCIDRLEWLQFVEKQVDLDFTNLFLQIIDANQDERLTLEEFRHFYQAYGIDIGDLEEAFHTLDIDRDGHISQKEFEKNFAQFLYSDDVQAPGNWLFGVNLPKKL